AVVSALQIGSDFSFRGRELERPCAVVSPRASASLPPGSVPRRVAIPTSEISGGTFRVANRRTDPMARDPKAEAALALHRFGFGPRAGSIAAIASDPRGALLAELERPGAGRIGRPDLLTSGEAARGAFNFRQERKAQRLAERAQREAAKDAPPP